MLAESLSMWHLYASRFLQMQVCSEIEREKKGVKISHVWSTIYSTANSAVFAKCLRAV